MWVCMARVITDPHAEAPGDDHTGNLRECRVLCIKKYIMRFKYYVFVQFV